MPSGVPQVAFSMQDLESSNLENHAEAPMHHSLKELLPQVSFLKVRSDPISAPSTNPNPPPCLLDRGRAS